MEERGIRIIGTDIAVATQLAGTITSDYPVWMDAPDLTEDICKLSESC